MRHWNRWARIPTPRSLPARRTSACGSTSRSTIPRKILDLNRVDELAGVAVENGELVLGSRASWTAIEEVCKDAVPEFYKIVSVFGAPQIRHVGTIGGNIANASPIADSLPFLHVMEAMLELRSAGGTRQVNINDFYKGYKKFDLQPGELITKIRVPLPTDDELLRLYKVSRRRDLDISSFTAAIRMRLDGESIADVAIALGAVGPTVIRARKTEAVFARPAVGRGNHATGWRCRGRRDYADQRRSRRGRLPVSTNAEHFVEVLPRERRRLTEMVVREGIVVMPSCRKTHTA